MKRFLMPLFAVLAVSFGSALGSTSVIKERKCLNNSITSKVVHSTGTIDVPFANQYGEGNGLYAAFYMNTSNAIWPFEDGFYYSFVVDYKAVYQTGASLSPNKKVDYRVNFHFIFTDKHTRGKGEYCHNSIMTRGAGSARIVDPKEKETNWVSCDSRGWNDEQTQDCKFTRKMNNDGWFDRWDANGVVLTADFAFDTVFTAHLETICYFL